MPVKTRRKTTKKTKAGAAKVSKSEAKKPVKLAKKRVNLSVKVKKTKPKKVKAVKPVIDQEALNKKNDAGASKPRQEHITKKAEITKNEEETVVYASRESAQKPTTVEKDKQLIMWSGVVFFMVLIIVFWIYNTKQVFNKTRAESNTNFSLADWQEAADDVGDRMNKLKSDLEKIRNFEEGDGAIGTTQADIPIEELKEKLLTASSTESDAKAESEKTQKEIDELKRKLEELENKLDQ